MLNTYILNEHGEPIVCNDILVWGRWFEKAHRHVAKDDIGDVHISTVFLGLDHNFTHGDPILWETMIFGGEHDGYQERYTTLEDAKVGHQKAVDLVTGVGTKASV